MNRRKIHQHLEILELQLKQLVWLCIAIKHGNHDQSTHGRGRGGGSGQVPVEELGQLTKDDPEFAQHPRKTKPGLITNRNPEWKKAGLNHAEGAAVRDYTDSGYQKMNKELRNPPPSSSSQTKEKLLNSGLEKMPAHKGNVFRMRADAPDWEVGGTIKESGFTSTSTNENMVRDKFAGKTLMRIKNKSGRNITSMSRFKGEDEVLVPSGAQYRITGKRKEGDITVYDMEEV